MDLFNLENDGASAGHAVEGVFDEQLSFDNALMRAPKGLCSVIKRDNREEPFSKAKIAAAIFKAAETLGGQDKDRATSLASGVALYLAKKAGAEKVTVEQINDAVEKVLIEMGHARTALAFARYRDKRDRIRRLRQGDMRSLLSELQEAGLEAQPAAPAEDPGGMIVRTSDERLTGWDRERIVEALRRETGMAEGLARIIALEVEGQIQAASVTTITAALVRELVDVRLLDRGLEEYRRKHMRLGVPLYDAERLICTPNHGEHEGPQDPVATDVTLARHVKREYALNEVLSREVAEAHLRGEIHVHDLGQIDRFHSGIHSPGFVARFGSVQSSNARYARPPKSPDGLFAQVSQWRNVLRNHFAVPIEWDSFNMFAAPWLVQLDHRALTETACLWSMAMAAESRTRPHLDSMTMDWATPLYIANEPAVGPGGDRFDESYAHFEPTAQAFMRALLEFLVQNGRTHCPHRLNIRVTPSFFECPDHQQVLLLASSCAAMGRPVRFCFQRSEPMSALGPVWQPRQLAAHRVTLNLPRAAYRASGEEALDAQLEILVRLAVHSVNEKTRFLEKLAGSKEFGPFARLGFEYGGDAYLDLNRAVGIIGVTGLAECIYHLTGKNVSESVDAREMAVRILRRLADRCATYAEHACLKLQIDESTSLAISRRLASLDLHYEPAKAAANVKADPLTQDVYYTPGARLNAARDITAHDRMEMEGLFHAVLQGAATTVIDLHEDNASAETLAGSVQNAFFRTRVSALQFEMGNSRQSMT